MTALNGIDKKTVELDHVLQNFSVFGRYQFERLWLAFLAYMSNGIYSCNFIFAAAEVSYRCQDESFSNATCSSSSNSSDWCPKWIYENPDSFVGEFDLGCQDWKRTLVGSAHSFGYMVGLLIVGPMSDRWGRKKMIVILGVTGGIIGVSKSFTTMYWLYIAFSFIESAAGDLYSPYFMLIIEMTSTKKRILYQMMCSLGFTFGGLLLPTAAYLFPYWRTLLKVLYAPALFFSLYWFLIDESPRWLLSKGKKDKAVSILEKIAKRNNIKLEKSILDKLSYEEEKEAGFLELLKNTFASRKLLKRFFVCLIWWTTSTFVNYGMTINSVSLQGNQYINYALISSMELPATLITMFLLTRFKRKIPLMFSFIVTAVLCLSQPFVSNDMAWLSILVYMLGKLMSTVYFSITYIYTSELFPTYTRNSMHALCSALGRVGSIIAPQTPLLMRYWIGLPSVVFGGASLLAGMITLLVPDTADDALPDNVKQAEALGKANSKQMRETAFVTSHKDMEKKEYEENTRF